jgi:hypothetical protein
MRASEFVSESKIGKIGNRKQVSTIGLHKFRDEDCADRVYELNRVMMAAASTDGTFVPDIDGESWSGRYNVAMPYTQEEQNMLMMAYKATGTDYHDLNKGDLASKELDGTNTQSTVKPFKGYKRK